MSNDNPKLKGFVTLQNIVSNVLNDKNIYSKENYKRYMQWVIRAYTQLNLYNLDSIEVDYLTMSDSGAVSLPDDYIKYTKIGVCSSGRVVVLGLNKDLCTPRGAECGIDINDYFNSSDPDIVSDGYYFAPHYRSGSYIPKLYGYTGGFAESYYKVDGERRQIQFSSSVNRNEIVLEYISSGISLSGVTYIPRQAVEPLIAFCHWQEAKFDAKTPVTKLRELKNDYLEEETKLTFFENAPTIQEIQDAMYSTWSQTPKR